MSATEQLAFTAPVLTATKDFLRRGTAPRHLVDLALCQDGDW